MSVVRLLYPFVRPMMLLGNARRDMYSNYPTNLNVPSHLMTPSSTPLSTSSTVTRTPITPQSTMMNYARASYRYTSVTLLSLRPPTEITIFPEHLVERRFLDEENYIDLDRMLSEKAGKFDLESFNMHDGPIMPSRIHKYDFSDPAVIEKVKNRRPKDPLTPQQVAALTSVATRHQSSTLVFPHQVQPAHVWIDDYSHQQAQLNSSRHHLPPQPSMPYQRQNPNQCEVYTNQIKSLLPTYRANIEQKNDQFSHGTETIPILRRLFEAQRLQQNEPRQINSLTDLTTEGYPPALSAFCTPSTPQRANPAKTFGWLFATDQSQKDTFSQLINEHLKGSTAMETPITPGVNTNGMNKTQRVEKDDDDDDEQNFYSAPPSPTQQEDLVSLFSNRSIDKSSFSTALENWFGDSIQKNAYPRMPSDRVLSACDLEQ